MKNEIEARLVERFRPTSLAIDDDSAQHVGHGAEGAHVRVAIVSAEFAGKSTLQRHRLVNDAMKDLIASGRVHALQISAKAPGE